MSTPPARTKGRELEALAYLSGCWVPPGTSGICKRSCPSPAVMAQWLEGGTMAQRQLRRKSTSRRSPTASSEPLRTGLWPRLQMTSPEKPHYITAICAPSFAAVSGNTSPGEASPSFVQVRRETTAAPAYHLPPHLPPLFRPQPGLHWDYCSSGLNSRERGLNASQDTS